MMRYGSVFSGIETATVAWHRLGWTPAFFSEIEPFCCALLAHHYPSIVNLGDITKFEDWPHDAIDLLVGGSPCQDFSIAGRREGLGGQRGRLTLVYLAVLRHFKPRWIVWENVPGVLSSNRGRDFGVFLGALSELGYGWAYRILDAQYVRVESHPRAVPQRRRRVILVGYLGDIRPAAAVLFEPACMCGDSPPRRETRESAARPISSDSANGSGYRNDADTAENLIARHVTTRGGQRLDAESETLIAHTLRGEGADASEAETGRGVPSQAIAFAENSRAELRLENGDGKAGQGVPMIAFSCKDSGADALHECAPTLRAMGHCDSHANAGGQLAVAFNLRGRDGGSQPEMVDVASVRAASGGSSRSYVAQTLTAEQHRSGGAAAGNNAGVINAVLPPAGGVRRLTPLECERLQGFPDGYTTIPYRGKQAKDGPRYKALGNSMAVNVMSWVGERIQMVESITKERAP